MRIKRQLLVTMAVFLAVLLVVSLSVGITNQQISQVYADEDTASNIENGADALNTLFSQYFLYQQDSQIAAWHSQFFTIQGNISKLSPSNSQQNALVSDIQVDLAQLNSTFSSLSLYLQTQPRNVSVRILPEFQNLWNQVVMQHQTLGIDAAHFSESLRSEADNLRQTTVFLTVGLMAAFACLLIVVYLMFFRRTLKSISNLQKGMNIVGSGNLEFRVNSEGEDEIRDLSRSFNGMVDNLQSLTTSKEDLEREISSRMKAEKIAEKRAEELETTHRKLEEKAAEVEEYAINMENLAEQRAIQLKDAERLATIGATAGMVGHDIRNPLQSITSDVYLIKSDLDSVEASPEKKNIMESLDEIEKNINYINKIVQDLQDYARPVAPIPKEVNLQNAIDDILRRNSTPSNIRVKVGVQQDASKLEVDPDYLKRVVGNLVTNAVQAMPEGGTLSIQTYKIGYAIEIHVQDTGIGIPEDVRSKLFTPLFTTKSKGQGFGLAVVKRLTEAMGGKVSFKSEKGMGTTFILRFPNTVKNNG